MKSRINAALAASAAALVAVGVALAAADRPAYGEPVARLSAADAREHADAIFACADQNRSETLDADEYAALAVVLAELSRLNGFVVLRSEIEDRIVPLPFQTPELTRSERTRIEAVARRDFYAAAGGDSQLSQAEYAEEQADRFADADRNRNGVLAAGELVAFAAHTASLDRSDA